MSSVGSKSYDVSLSPSPDLDASKSPNVNRSPSPDLDASETPNVNRSPSPDLDASEPPTSIVHQAPTSMLLNPPTSIVHQTPTSMILKPPSHSPTLDLDASETSETASFSGFADEDFVNQSGETAMARLVREHRRKETGYQSGSGGLIPGSFKSWGWSLLLVSLMAVVVSLFFVGGWHPAMTRRVSLDHRAFLKPDLQKTNRQMDHLEVLLTNRKVDMKKLNHRLDILETRLSNEGSKMKDLWKILDNVSVKLDKLLRRSHIVDEPTVTSPSLRQINWLSFDLGARAITQKCSPVYPQKSPKTIHLPTGEETGGWNFLDQLLAGRDLMVESAPIPPPRLEDMDYGPNMVLKPWRENEPRYCTLGRTVQLAVKLRTPIAPHTLVMEYYLKDEVPAAGPAPKEVELWIPISNDTARAAVIRSITGLYPDILAGQTAGTDKLPAEEDGLGTDEIPVDKNDLGTDEIPAGENGPDTDEIHADENDTDELPAEENGTDELPAEEENDLGSDLVPVGRWKYDIHAGEIAQFFPVPIDLEALDVAVDKVVIRVNSNWGTFTPVTCLVRVKMYGIDKNGLHENLDPFGRW
ncbi:hypothetical protein MMC07_009892 [Pseudocyphellaria aurata]|nr:hypothetical protein [Pseudocyphellaria aurata]